MWHFREIGDDRVSSNILTQCQRQRGCKIVVDARLDDFTERDELANLVRNLQADVRFTRNHVHDAHTDGRQRACEIF